MASSLRPDKTFGYSFGTPARRAFVRSRTLFAWALTLIFVVSLVALTGCGSSATSTSSDTSKQAGGNGGTAASGQGASQAPQPGEEPLYTPTYKPNGNEIAVITTPKGVIKFKFYPKDAPNHVAAFIELAKKGFYDGTKFHRVEPGFVIQGGDPLSKTDDPMTGTGGPGYRLAAEFNSQKHLDGTVAMARSTDENSAGSQFYIDLGPQPSLDGKYTVFGQVIEGMDVVRSIAKGDVMTSVTIQNAQ
jgi:peptidyl-prolyl cis-trans isomerase B (cyclophilin B)